MDVVKIISWLKGFFGDLRKFQFDISKWFCDVIDRLIVLVLIRLNGSRHRFKRTMFRNITQSVSHLAKSWQNTGSICAYLTSLATQTKLNCKPIKLKDKINVNSLEYKCCVYIVIRSWLTMSNQETFIQELLENFEEIIP